MTGERRGRATENPAGSPRTKAFPCLPPSFLTWSPRSFLSYKEQTQQLLLITRDGKNTETKEQQLNKNNKKTRNVKKEK